MSTETRTTASTESPVPVSTGDTHSYKGWLNSDSFLKRAFAIYGYSFVASLIISVPIFIIAAIIAVVGVVSFMGGAVSAPTSDTPVVQQEVFIEGKLNINEICDGSLTYTTFLSGAEADAYLKDCKEGRHPEVIERYKTEMGLGDGAEV